MHLQRSTHRNSAQLNLWDVPAPEPPAGKTPTSAAAAESVRPVTGKLRQLVYSRIVEAGEHGATREELSIQLGLKESTTSARCNELLKMGAIAESGHVRPTTSGRAAAVLIAGMED